MSIEYPDHEVDEEAREAAFEKIREGFAELIHAVTGETGVMIENILGGAVYNSNEKLADPDSLPGWQIAKPDNQSIFPTMGNARAIDAWVDAEFQAMMFEADEQ